MIKFQTEFFIGSNRDGGSDVYDAGKTQGFGHLLVFGQGGIFTEIYKDFAYALVPVNIDYILEQLEKTRIFKIMEGARGQERMAIGEVVDTIFKIQKMVLLYPEIVSLDLNPLLVTEDRAIAVDIKVFV
jgi:acetyltransferase